MKEALFWERVDERVHCYLCPRDCHLGEGQSGFCYVRKNIGGTLYNLAYANPCAVHIDPIEKKPLFHFLPGSKILSLGTIGCNLGCKFCQNWDISKAKQEKVRAVDLPPEAVVEAALEHKCQSIAFTYNEPTIWAEYAMDIAKKGKKAGLKHVMVTNGYINIEPLKEIYHYIDAANVDLKSFTENFYSKITLSHLKPVLSAIIKMKQLGVWVEITTLLIPTLNDTQQEIKELTTWIKDNVGCDVPLHFTAFHPDYKLTDLPGTPIKTINTARQIARDTGLHYVYEGNIYSDGSNTYCLKCGTLLIARDWHTIKINNLQGNRCSCGWELQGVFI